MRRIPPPAELAQYNENHRLLKVPKNQDGTPSFATAREALEAIEPPKAKALEALAPTPAAIEGAKALLAHTGMNGPDDYLALLPKVDELAVHQAAGSAVLSFVIRHGSVSRGKALTRVAAANPWFRKSSFAKNDKRLRQKAQRVLKRPPRPRR
jgi:hypothetical protein